MTQGFSLKKNVFFLLFRLFNHLFCVCLSTRTQVHIEVKGQFLGVGSVFPPRVFWASRGSSGLVASVFTYRSSPLAQGFRFYLVNLVSKSLPTQPYLSALPVGIPDLLT